MASQPKISQIGPYQILEELGRGAMGVVFRGFDPGISRPVAVKVIRPQQLSSADQSAEARLRFAREAKAAGRLSHPNIVTVYQVGEDRGYLYMAMEFVEGTTLNSLLSPGVPMDADKALDIVRQISDALDHAHQQEVVHRDIKPSNILVRPDGKVKIADFGIARVASQTLTQQGMTLGTPAYMSPEQIRGLKVDGRADQFSLAVLAYQMLTGYKPFEASTEQALILSIVSDPPKPVHQANNDISSAATAVFNRALDKEPAARYPTCAEFSSALAASLKAAPQPLPAVIPEPAVGAKRRGVSAGTLVMVALGAVIAVMIAYLYLRQPAVHSAPPTAAAPHVTAPAPVAEAPVKPAAKITSRRPVSHSKIKDLESRRQQVAADLDQAQKELNDLRLQAPDSPDVQTAAARVDKLRKSLEEIDDNLAALKSAR